MLRHPHKVWNTHTLTLVRLHYGLLMADWAYWFQHLPLSLTSLHLPDLTQSLFSLIHPHTRLAHLQSLSCCFALKALLIPPLWVCQQTQNFVLWRGSRGIVAPASMARRMPSTNPLTSNPGGNGKALHLWCATPVITVHFLCIHYDLRVFVACTACINICLAKYILQKCMVLLTTYSYWQSM